MSGDTTYSPKKGDRVRVTRVWEGVVGSTECTGFRVDSDEGKTLGPWFDFHPSADMLSRGLVTHTVEKLADPEPEWGNGDQIEVLYDRGGRYEQWRKLVLIGGQWTHVNTGEKVGPHFMHNHWPEDVKILYKADIQDAPNEVPL